MLPETVSDLLHGESPPAPPERLRLRDTADVPWQKGGWTLLAERPGRRDRPGLGRQVLEAGDFVCFVAAEDFKEFAEPGYAKTRLLDSASASSTMAPLC